MIKEFREFFIRNTVVSTGAKKDQEINFPVSYLVGQVQKFNRFLKGHYPSENVMKKFVHSITFKLNPEDTAKEAEQGLAKKATDAKSIERDSSDAAGMTTFVLPHQLPNILNADDDVSIVIEDVVTDLGSGKTRKDFKIRAVADSTPRNILANLISLTGIGTGANLAETTLMSYNLPANTLTISGDQIVITTNAQLTSDNAVDFKLRAGAIELMKIPFEGVQNDHSVDITAIISRVTANSQLLNITVHRGYNIISTYKKVVSLDLDLAIANLISITGQNKETAVADQIKAYQLCVILNKMKV